MSLEVAFKLSEEDLTYFRNVMKNAQVSACIADETEIVAEAQKLLDSVDRGSEPKFVQERLSKLQSLINMLDDPEWPLEDDERTDVVSALTYFYHAEDLIPDDIPVLGFIDDAIMIELVIRELKDEIDAFEDFCEFRDTEEQVRGLEVSRDEWLVARRRELMGRMRERANRRHRARRSVGGRLTGFTFTGS